MTLAAALRTSVAAAGLALALPASAHALAMLGPCMNRVNYPVTITDPTVGGIRNGFIVLDYVNGSGVTWPAGAHLDENGHGIVEDYFPKDFCTNPPLQGFVIGIAGDPWEDMGGWDPTNPSASHHVVMLANQAITPLLTDGRDFADLFLASEDEVLNNLFYGTTVECHDDHQGAGCAGVSYVWDFAHRLRNGPNAIGPNTTTDCAEDPETGEPVCNPVYDTRNAWFGIPGPGAAPTGFDVVKFSSGTLAGSGFVSVTPAAVVPEPTTWVLLLTGLAGVGAAARRRMTEFAGKPRVAD